MRPEGGQSPFDRGRAKIALRANQLAAEIGVPGLQLCWEEEPWGAIHCPRPPSGGCYLILRADEHSVAQVFLADWITASADQVSSEAREALDLAFETLHLRRWSSRMERGG